MRRVVNRLLPVAWMLVIYGGTTLLAHADPAPTCCGLSRGVFEVRHALTHVASFGLEVWLLCRAVSLPGLPKVTRVALIAIGVGVALGFGQETLQALLRGQVYWLDSLWDLGVDVCGSTLGWWLYNLRPVSMPPAGSDDIL